MTTVFDPIKLERITLKNRIVRSAFQNNNNNENNTVPLRKVREYEELAKNQVGTIITGQVAVTPTGIVGFRQDALYLDWQIEEEKKLTEAVHPYGCKIIAQINHSGPKASKETMRGIAPLGPSAVQYADNCSVAREISIEEIQAIEDEFAAAALRAKLAGFDGVQIHAAHSYLLSSFMNPMYNKRQDQYGGNKENRFRIIREVTEKIRKAVGEAYPIFLKTDSNVVDNDESYEQDLIYFVKECKAIGIEAVELSGFNYMKLGMEGKRTYFLDRAAKIREESQLPIMLVGGIRSLEDMQRVMDAGIDMASIARPFCCEPDLITRLLAGQKEASCVNCGLCFAQFLKDGRNCVRHPK